MSKKKRVVIKKETDIINQGKNMTDETNEKIEETFSNEEQETLSNVNDVEDSSNKEEPVVEEELPVIEDLTDLKINEQDTQQQPTNESAVVDTTAVENKTINQSNVSTKPEVINTKEQNLSDFEKFELKVLSEGSEHEKNLIIGLKDYLEFMKPKKPIEPQEGLLKQKQLLEYIKGVLRIADKQNFKKCWKLLIKYFEQYSKPGYALHEAYINRFTERWSTGPDQLNAFRNLTHLLKETAQKGVNSKLLKTVSIDTITKSNYFKEEERQKILDFYNS